MEVPLQIALCEDQSEDIALLLDLIEKSGVPFVCSAFSSGEDLLEAFSPGRYDVIFFDIYMAGMPGVEAAAKIRQEDERVMLAFTTASSDHTLESYRLGALKYLEKPVQEKDVREMLELALSRRKAVPRISLLAEGKKQYIAVDNILYMELQNHTVVLHTLSGSLCASQKVKLSQIEAMLPCPPFYRCHHSFIVNLRYVRELNQELKLFIMQGGGKAYIRRQDIRRAAKAYEDELFRGTRGAKVWE